MQIQENAPGKKTITANKETSLQLCKCCKKRRTCQYDDCYPLDKNKDKRPQWYVDVIEKRAKAKAEKTKKNK